MTTARFDPIRLKVICVALVAAYPMLAEAGVAGRVQFVAGDVRIVDDKGVQRPMRKGQDVNEGDTVLSGPDGSAQVKMIDGAIVAVRPGTELKVIDYAFDEKDSSKESASFSLVKGGLRAITGLIGKTNKDRYKLATPTATIGIRGTDHEPVVVLPGQNGLVADAPPGTYDKVNVGATTLTTQAGTTIVAANQVGFAASPTQLPVILPKVPDFYRATPAPKPQAQQKQEQEKKQEQADASSTSSEQSSSSDSASTSASSEKKTSAAAATTTSAAAATSLTAVDASGNTLNLSRQTLTTASGQTLDLTGSPVTTNPQPTGSFEQVIATFPGQTTTDDGQIFTFPAMFFFDGPSQGITRDAAGNIVAVTHHGDDGFSYRSTLTQSGATMTDTGTHSATGLSWGRWQGGQVTQTIQQVGMDATGKWGLGAYNDAGDFVVGATQTEKSVANSGSLHWIAGKAAAPEFLSRVLTGSASYTLVGGTRPTDQHGNLGTLNSASLGVNFTTQLVNASVNFSIAGNTWALQSNDMALLDGPHFSSYNWCFDGCTSNTTLTKNGAPVGSNASPTSGFAFASMNGTLLGTGLNAAALQYAVQETVPVTQVGSNGETLTSFTHSTIQGVAGFSGPAQDVQTPFRMVGVVDGMDSGDAILDDFIATDANGFFRGGVEGDAAPAGRVVDSAAGLTEFVGSAFSFTPAGGGSPVDAEVPATIKIGTAVNRDVGSATIGGATVSWGRWEGGSVDIYSRDGSTRLGTIDNSGRSMHWLASSVLTGGSGFTSLPLTGTATYTIAGNTNPTDFLGNVGTLNSATLSADFANARANAGVNVSFNAPTNTSNWVMTANNIPLEGRGGFESSTLLNGVNGISHTASCTGASCGAQTIGHVDGGFFAGGQGAVLMYGMATGATTAGSATSSPVFTPSNAVTGVAVMKR